MTRTLSGAIDTAIQQDTIYAAYLLQFDFDSGTEYFWSGAGDLVWDGHTWTGAGDMGSISGFEEKTDLSGSTIEVSLSHVETSALADLVNEFDALDPKGRGFSLYMAFFTEAGAINDVHALTSGYIDGSAITAGEDGALKILLSTEASRLDRSIFRVYSAQHQEALFAGDLGMAFVTDLDDEIIWGHAPVKVISGGGVASGGGGGRRTYDDVFTD